jgi:hypothetical protein
MVQLYVARLQTHCNSTDILESCFVLSKALAALVSIHSLLCPS